MGAASISLEELFKRTKNISSARYRQFKGKKYKAQELLDMDPQVKEQLEMGPGLDWSEIDKELEILNKEYVKETNIIQREIISLKYDLLLEEFVETDHEKVEKLKNKLNKLMALMSE